MVTDKLWLSYGPRYDALAEEVFPRLRGEPPLLIVELGVAHAAGLLYFQELFPGARLVGVDNNQECVDKCHGYGFPDVFYADQSDPQLGDKLAAYGSPHVVVDDCSHIAGPTLHSLARVWPIVRPGGWYVIEDWTHVDTDNSLKILRGAMGYVEAGQVSSAIVDLTGLIMLQKDDPDRPPRYGNFPARPTTHAQPGVGGDPSENPADVFAKAQAIMDSQVAADYL